MVLNHMKHVVWQKSVELPAIWACVVGRITDPIPIVHHSQVPFQTVCWLVAKPASNSAVWFIRRHDEIELTRNPPKQLKHLDIRPFLIYLHTLTLLTGNFCPGQCTRTKGKPMIVPEQVLCFPRWITNPRAACDRTGNQKTILHLNSDRPRSI